MARWEDLLWEWPEVGSNATAENDAYLTDPPSTTTSSMLPPNPLTESQEILLNSLQIASALLSLGGSCTILYKILRGLYKNQTTTPYDRIILGLSSCDIVASVTHALSPFLLPSETSVRVWAMGTAQTCSVLGFLTQVAAFWAVWYNCVLSFYYLLTVRFKVKRRTLHQKHELWMHLSGAVFFPTTALVGLFGNYYGEQALSISCWVRSVGSSDNTNYQARSEIASYVFATPVMVSFVAIVANNIVIYRHVRRTLVLPHRHKDGSTSDIENHGAASSNDSNPNPARRRSSNGSNSNSNSGASRSSEKSLQEKLAREAAIQCFLYVSCFLVTTTPVAIVQVMDGSLGYDVEDRASIYPLLVVSSMLVPLMGFLNVFIYVRPSYHRFTTAHPDKSRLEILRLALLESEIPRMSSVAPSHSFSNNNNIQKHQRYSSGSGSSGSGGERRRNLGGDRDSPFAIAIDRKHSQMRSTGGSNFETSLHHIAEENEREEEPSDYAEEEEDSDECDSDSDSEKSNSSSSECGDGLSVFIGDH